MIRGAAYRVDLARTTARRRRSPKTGSVPLRTAAWQPAATRLRPEPDLAGRRTHRLAADALFSGHPARRWQPMRLPLRLVGAPSALRPTRSAEKPTPRLAPLQHPQRLVRTDRLRLIQHQSGARCSSGSWATIWLVHSGQPTDSFRRRVV